VLHPRRRLRRGEARRQRCLRPLERGEALCDLRDRLLRLGPRSLHRGSRVGACRQRGRGIGCELRGGCGAGAVRRRTGGRPARAAVAPGPDEPCRSAPTPARRAPRSPRRPRAVGAGRTLPDGRGRLIRHLRQPYHLCRRLFICACSLRRKSIHASAQPEANGASRIACCRPESASPC